MFEYICVILFQIKYTHCNAMARIRFGPEQDCMWKWRNRNWRNWKLISSCTRKSQPFLTKKVIESDETLFLNHACWLSFGFKNANKTIQQTNSWLAIREMKRKFLLPNYPINFLPSELIKLEKSGFLVISVGKKYALMRFCHFNGLLRGSSMNTLWNRWTMNYDTYSGVKC